MIIKLDTRLLHALSKAKLGHTAKSKPKSHPSASLSLRAWLGIKGGQIEFDDFRPKIDFDSLDNTSIQMLEPTQERFDILSQQLIHYLAPIG